MADAHQDNPLEEFLIREDMSVLDKYATRSGTEKITINVKCVYPDPQNPGQLLTRIGSVSCESNKPVDRVAKEFLDTYRDIPNKTYYLGYDQLLFKDGTLAECGITQGKTVELYAPGKNAAVYHNEGLAMIVWSCIFFIIGFASLIFAMSTGTSVDTNYQAFFLFLGLLLVIPSALAIILGAILIPSCPMPCYFSGTEWC